MCGGNSFSATTNTLAELVEIVRAHLEREDHKQYFARHQEDAKKYRSSLEKRPIKTETILSSPMFSWSIAGLDPFTEICRLAKIPPFPC
jgi:hypothetical protein